MCVSQRHLFCLAFAEAIITRTHLSLSLNSHSPLRSLPQCLLCLPSLFLLLKPHLFDCFIPLLPDCLFFTGWYVPLFWPVAIPVSNRSSLWQPDIGGKIKRSVDSALFPAGCNSLSIFRLWMPQSFQFFASCCSALLCFEGLAVAAGNSRTGAGRRRRKMGDATTELVEAFLRAESWRFGGGVSLVAGAGRGLRAGSVRVRTRLFYCC